MAEFMKQKYYERLSNDDGTPSWTTSIKKPLPTFALEIMGVKGAEGWFVKDGLKTRYYLFIWPHAADGSTVTTDRLFCLSLLYAKESEQRHYTFPKQGKCRQMGKNMLSWQKTGGNRGMCVGSRLLAYRG